ncbi:MAG: ExbD/TolR family protein [Burkholderiaceae bacterium]
MNFRRSLHRDEPELNFIPLIDLLLVVLIFVLVTTTYSRVSEVQVNLPSSATESAALPAQIEVTIGADGRHAIDGQRVEWSDSAAFAVALTRAAAQREQLTVVIHADASATHQSVIQVLEAARIAGLARVSFATQTASSPGASPRTPPR